MKRELTSVDVVNMKMKTLIITSERDVGRVVEMFYEGCIDPIILDRNQHDVLIAGRTIELHEGEVFIKICKKPKQFFPDNTLVRFNLNSLSASVFEDMEEEAERYNTELASIMCLAVGDGTGEDKNSEYYDIEFYNGVVFHAVSGFHLKKVFEDMK